MRALAIGAKAAFIANPRVSTNRLVNVQWDIFAQRKVRTPNREYVQVNLKYTKLSRISKYFSLLTDTGEHV